MYALWLGNAEDSAKGVPHDMADKLGMKSTTSIWKTTTRREGASLMPMKNTPHPGDFIRTEIIQPAGLSVTAAAAALKVSRPALSSLLNGKADLSGDMALRIEKAFGVKMDTLMRMQSSYDIARTRLREGQIRVRRIPLQAHVQA
jgi:addiction module HigA family antidote